MKSKPQPLLDYTSGEVQDRRASLISAFRRIADGRRKRKPTDLHVRELLTYVLARDGGTEGLKISFDDLARVLECDKRTARHVVYRAVNEFGLLEAIEQRYASCAQDANLYRILWPVVRFVNSQGTAAENCSLQKKPATENCSSRPLEEAENCSSPPDNQCHPPATDCHPPDNQCHPTTLSYSLTSSLEETTTTLALRTARAATTENCSWEVVVVALEECGVSLAAAAVGKAKALGHTAKRCMELVDQWRKSDFADNPGVLYRWLTMARSAPKQPARKPLGTRNTIGITLRMELDRIAMVNRKREELKQRYGVKVLDDEQQAELDAFIASMEVHA